MKMTPAMEAYTRQVAAEIGRDPAELIAEGEQHMDAGYHSAAAAAHAADTAAMSRISGSPACPPTAAAPSPPAS